MLREILANDENDESNIEEEKGGEKKKGETVEQWKEKRERDRAKLKASADLVTVWADLAKKQDAGGGGWGIPSFGMGKPSKPNPDIGVESNFLMKRLIIAAGLGDVNGFEGGSGDPVVTAGCPKPEEV